MATLQDPLSANSTAHEHFHKSLKIDDNFRVDTTQWEMLRDACLNPNVTVGIIEAIGAGALPPMGPAQQSAFKPGATPSGPSPFVSPMAAWSGTDGLSPDPKDLKMPPPPSPTSKAMAAEMNELYWMSALRDEPFETLAQKVTALGAVDDINKGYNDGIAENKQIATLRDIPLDGANKANFTKDTIFRMGLGGTPGGTFETDGPFVSQFFLHPINYGAQLILPTQHPYRANQDYLYTLGDWLLAQNTGLDRDGNAYNHDNDAGFDRNHFEYTLDANGNPVFPRYYIRNMRDLCRFVNRDALHQAYFNAALLLNNWNAPPNPGNALKKVNAKRQGGFATLGGPDSLALVSWMACDAIRTVWHQKWRIWLRMRPEAFGGIATIAPNQLGGAFTALQGLQGHANKTAPDNYLLPLAFSAGSPAHPSYGAGHASVAGACVTLLKAWFDGSAKLVDIFAKAPRIDPSMDDPKILKPPVGSGEPPESTDPKDQKLTVEGELNKLAANVAMGRSMGGVHFRTDNTRSLRLGELVTTVFLANFIKSYQEDGQEFRFTSFDGNNVDVTKGGVIVNGGAAMDAKKLVARYNDAGHI